MKYMVVALDTNYKAPLSMNWTPERDAIAGNLQEKDKEIEFNWIDTELTTGRDRRKAISQRAAENPTLFDWQYSGNAYKTDKELIEMGKAKIKPKFGVGVTHSDTTDKPEKLTATHDVKKCAKGDCGVNHFIGGEFGNKGLMTNIVGVYDNDSDAEKMAHEWANIMYHQGQIDDENQSQSIFGIKHHAVSTKMMNSAGVTDGMYKHGLGRWNKLMVIPFDESKLPDKLSSEGKGEVAWDAFELPKNPKTTKIYGDKAGTKVYPKGKGEIGDLYFHVLFGAGPKVDNLIKESYSEEVGETGYSSAQVDWEKQIEDDYKIIKDALGGDKKKTLSFPQYTGKDKYADKKSGFSRHTPFDTTITDFGDKQKRREELLFQMLMNGFAKDALGQDRAVEDGEELGTHYVRKMKTVADVKNLILDDLKKREKLFEELERRQTVPKNASIFDLEELGVGADVKGHMDVQGWKGGPRREGSSLNPKSVLRSTTWLRAMQDDANFQRQGRIALEAAGAVSPFTDDELTTKSEQIWGARVNNEELQGMVRDTIGHKRPLMIWGPPGIGKSQAITQVVNEERTKQDGDPNFGFKDLRLSQLDDLDLRGIPIAEDKKFIDAPIGDEGYDVGLTIPDGEGGNMAGKVGYRGRNPNPNYDKTVFKLPSFLPTEGNGVLFLDEVNQAKKSVQNAAFQLVLDRKIGDYTVPDGWSIVAAGNRNQDLGVWAENAEDEGTEDFSSALNNRFRHVVLKIPEPEGWLKWAGEDADPVQKRLKAQKGTEKSFEVISLPTEDDHNKFTADDGTADSGMKRQLKIEYGDTLKEVEQKFSGFKKGTLVTDEDGVEKYRLPSGSAANQRVAYSSNKNGYLIDENIRKFIRSHPAFLYAMDDKRRDVDSDVKGKKITYDDLPKDLDGGVKSNTAYKNILGEEGEYEYFKDDKTKDHDKAYPSPRQWEFLSDTITEMPQREYLPVGTILRDNQKRLREIVSDEKWKNASESDKANRYLQQGKFWGTVYNGNPIGSPETVQDGEEDIRKIRRKAISSTGVLAGLAFQNFVGGSDRYLEKTSAGKFLGMKTGKDGKVIFDGKKSATRPFGTTHEGALTASINSLIPGIAKKAAKDGQTDQLIENFTVLLTRTGKKIESPEKDKDGNPVWAVDKVPGGGWNVGVEVNNKWLGMLAGFAQAVDKENGWGKEDTNPVWTAAVTNDPKIKKMTKPEKQKAMEKRGIPEKVWIGDGSTVERIKDNLKKYPDLNRRFNAMMDPSADPSSSVSGKNYYDRFGKFQNSSNTPSVPPKANAGNVTGVGTSKQTNSKQKLV